METAMAKFTLHNPAPAVEPEIDPAALGRQETVHAEQAGGGAENHQDREVGEDEEKDSLHGYSPVSARTAFPDLWPPRRSFKAPARP